jgi:valyl-tRNA synthetase
MMNLEDGFEPNANFVSEHSTRADKWILSRLQRVIDDVNNALIEYRFNDAASSLYHFIWHEYCDWYVESSKRSLKDENPAIRRATQTALVVTLETALRLLHPMMPFISEEIWQKLPISVRGSADSIMVAAFPNTNCKLINIENENYMQPWMDNTLVVRNIRGEMNIPPSIRPKAIIKPNSEDVLKNLEETASYMTSLSGLSDVQIAMDAVAPPGSATGTSSWAVISLVLPEKHIDANAERDRLQKEIAKISKDIELFSKKLSNKNFVNKAPREVVEKDSAKLEEFRAKRDKLEKSLVKLSEGI